MRRLFAKHFKSSLLLLGCCFCATTGQAQLSSNPDKFLGNITTSYNVDWGNEAYYTLWNQITPENESKWGLVEGIRGRYSWGCDTPFNYAISHGFTYKFHTLVWGSQYPNWLPDLSPSERYAAVVKWYDAVKAKYNTLPMIDVVNEAIDGHQPGNPMMKETMGGGGKTGYDWLIKAFEMAYERWPDAILIYNDYNTFQWSINEYINLVRTLRDAGAPIDAYGCQSHDVTDMNVNDFKNAVTNIQNALKMPFYSTEYDIGTYDDNYQLQRYKEQIPYMWEQDYCAGITLWGYIYGRTWTENGNSGIIKDGADRPAMTWLRQYMQSAAAKNAKSPFPGMKKQVSVYVKPAAMKVAKGDKLPILVRTHVTAPDKVIAKVELYVDNTLVSTMTEAPYLTEYEVPTNATAGTKTLKAIVTTTDGTTYERLSRFSVLSSNIIRKPYNDVVAEIPGTILVKNYDQSASGVAYSTNATRNKAATRDGAWMEYTVDVKEDGLYSFDAVLASNKDGGMFHLAEYSLENLEYLTEYVEVPNTGSATNYQSLHGYLQVPLKAGRHVICLNIDKGGFYIDKITFTRYEESKDITVAVSSIKPNIIGLGETSTITVTASSSASTIDHISVYANNLLVGTVSEAPYTVEFAPTMKGYHYITAIATDTEGRQNTSARKTMKVNGQRIPYKGIIAIPGIIQAENFDKGGEGFTFHDSDSKDEGQASYRTDNEGVDIVKSGTTYAIGYTAVGEWLEYTINVTEPGKYLYEATVSSEVAASSFTINLKNDGSTTQLWKVAVPKTGANTYETVTTTAAKSLSAGQQTLRIQITAAKCCIDKIELKCVESDGIDLVNADAKGAPLYNLQGMKVGDGYQGLVIRNGCKVLNRKK